MSDGSAIQWTDATWNPTRGCSVVSPGCVNCYAMKQAHRFDRPGGAYEGLTKMTAQGAQWSGRVALVEAALTIPLRWRKPRRIFVDSMSDLFHEQVPDEWIDRVFAVMALAPHHTFQVLTKRPERMRAYMTGEGLVGGADGRAWRVREAARSVAPHLLDEMVWPLPNVWLGVSVEDQARADERIPLLLDTPAAVRFISAEPLLGPIDIDDYLPGADYASHHHGRGLDWVIVGGESGPKARPFDLRWPRSLRDQCREARAAFFLKQLGRRTYGNGNPPGISRWILSDGVKEGEWVPPVIGPNAHVRPGNAVGYVLGKRAQGTESEWPEDLRGCRAFPVGERP